MVKYIHSIFGSANFMEMLKEKFHEQSQHDEVPESRILRPEIDKIFEFVCGEYGREMGELLSRSGIANEPRDVAMYLIRTLTGQALASIGRLFNLKRHSSVRTAIMGVQRRMEWT